MSAAAKPLRKVRCAIYTRKSSEEGLEMEFNSLDAQRESCAAYIASQKAEGWVPVPDHYDDGGFSGGNLERPALRRLLADIESGLIDVVVVYKIDRLSRSLMDFSKLVEVFDRNAVTFVSVTQSFNTTTSMGRLTLNILLSFAQFEREVIGERIRDKFAASRRKGMWMGGVPPLGYDVVARKLVVNPAEADLVRHIFDRFLKIGSATLLVKELNAAGYRTKSWTTQDGKARDGVPDVDLVAFMRVTHSRRIFIQQIGRGLRTSPKKDKVIVLDFVSDLRRLAEVVELEKAAKGGDLEQLPMGSNIVRFREASAGSFMVEWLKDQADLMLREGESNLEIPMFDFPDVPQPGSVQ
ncbi:MAG: recombinase family protein [Phaeospirillum sp.]|nr:recombinase family protein [Phaeospirillum sp.]